jgi:hypothetical protein
VGKRSGMVVPLEVTSCSVVEAKHSGANPLEHHSLLAGTAVLWPFVLVDTAIVSLPEWMKKSCCSVGRNLELMFSGVVGIVIASAA